ncbi:Site-specific recombinase XerD [Lacrimispora sphenoides]|uniref:tyrosine-type recombinase/integrase n=1 Tax=Lacrimispora sphenoides TaxID=29370 RepID=UPI0008AE2270|nr:tyrosine-type recombinase/integrase [Lacrimispora sphenoides]SEU07965.1 Site-specific recombinase XerD [Lacrimispora sphenoides]
MCSSITSSVIDSIMIELSENNIITADKLSDTKMILEICLLKYNISEIEQKNEISTDVDRTQFYLQQFLLNMKLRGCTAGSIKSYNNELKNFLLYINKQINDITYHDIQNFLAYGKIHKKWADRTYNIKLIIIRSFFAFLYEEDYIKTNPGKKLHETKVEHKIGIIVTPYQREEIKCACKNEREQAMCEMLYSTGARISELCALNIHDINFHNMSAIVYGKGRKEREIYFNAPTKLHLEKYLDSRSDNNPALFVISKKPYTRLTPSSVRAMLKRIKQRDDNIANIKLTPHVFRRTVGTDMINKGAPLEIVAEKLGHIKLDTTRQCYASISRNTVHQANNKYIG